MKHRAWLVPLLVLIAVASLGLVTSGCAKKEQMKTETAPEEVPVTERAAAFLASYNTDFAAAERAWSLGYWQAANSGKKEDWDAYAQAHLALKRLHADRARYKELMALKEHAAALDPISRRSLAVAELAFKGNQLPDELLERLVEASTEIEQTFNSFRADFEGEKVTNNDLLEVLRKESKTARRKEAWLALKAVGARVGGKLVALAKVRNEAARVLGYASFWEMQIRMQEHDPAMLLALFDELESKTTKPFRVMKRKLDTEIGRRFQVPADDLMPWHYDNPFFQDPPPSEAVNPDKFFEHMKREDIVVIGQRFYEDIGLPVGDIVANSDFYEREGKDQHAFCITIDRERDVRMLLNIKPTQAWMDTMLHEAGHAVYYANIDLDLPFNLREAAHIFTTEGIAMLFGALGKNPTWLESYAGADPEQIKVLAPALMEQRKREQLIFARWAMVMFRFERALYEDPEQDLNKLWYDLIDRFQMLQRPEGRDLPDWAAKPHFTIAPVYYHNYLLGELFAAQLRLKIADVADHAGPSATLDYKGREDIGRYLIDRVFVPGMRQTWPGFVKAATGTSLSAEAFAMEVR
jgi:peptidyl-dipeptidase A